MTKRQSGKTVKTLFALALLASLIAFAGCTGKSGNTGAETEPSVSRDLLTFTPASVDNHALTEKGRSPQIIIKNYNETATDALGRTLPTSAETGLPAENKYVGLFYSLWTSDIAASVDVARSLAMNPKRPNFGPRWGFCFWSEPETGYHKADDVWQIRRDMYYFDMAGVDFIYIDMTNGYLYEDAMKVLLDTCIGLREEGQMTPYVVPWCFGTDNGGGDIGKFYRLFMEDEKYKDLWFRWDGKPLALIKCTDDGAFPILDDADFAEKLTFRKSWVGSGEQYWVDGGVFFGYSYGWMNDPDKAECVGIGTAGFANYGEGRSWDKSRKQYLDQFWETPTMGEGLTFERTFNMLMENNPECEVMLITRWNEWIAQNFTLEVPKYSDTGYVDEFNPEFSRDIEPMKGGFTDNYFYQMCSIIRRFKGVLPPDGNTGKRTVDVDAGFGQWQEILPVYTDFSGDTLDRDSTDTTGKIKYVNETGRNDIVESRMTADGGMIYAYARTAEPLTDISGRNWMLLFIDSDNDKATGWEGYNYVVNYSIAGGSLTAVCEYRDNVWQETGLAAYRAEGGELMIAIPRSLLGLTGDDFTVNFHWMDNVSDIYSLEAWFTTGDSAPERRNNYTLTMDVPYAAGEEKTVSALPDRKPVTYMPEAELTEAERSSMKKGVSVTTYKLMADYGKMPVFRLIEGNMQTSFAADAVTAALDFSREENFAAAYGAYVKIDADAAVTFTLTCDDCARLYVDGRLVAECAYDESRAADGKTSSSGSLRLAAGYHEVRVEYAEVRCGNRFLSLDISDGELYCPARTEKFAVDLSKVRGVGGNPKHVDSSLEIRSYNTVFALGDMDLSRYGKVEIEYGSDGNAMLGDVGSYFAITDSKSAATRKRKSNVLAEAVLENAAGAFWIPDRKAEIDLSGVDYSGEVFLAVFMGDFNGITIYSITFS